MCLYVLYKTCARVNIDPMGQTLKKRVTYFVYTLNVVETSQIKTGFKDCAE